MGKWGVYFCGLLLFLLLTRATRTERNKRQRRADDDDNKKEERKSVFCDTHFFQLDTPPPIDKCSYPLVRGHNRSK